MINLQELVFFKALTHKVDSEDTSGDMKKEVFDPTSEVETSGGIPEFVKSHGGTAFVIPLTENNGAYSTNVTYSEIKAAYDSKRIIVVSIGSSAILPMLNAEFTDDSAGMTFGYTQVMLGGSSVSTRAIHYLHTPEEDIWEDADFEFDASLYQEKPIWEEITSIILSSDQNYIEVDFPSGYSEYIFEIYSPMPGESSNAAVYPYNSYYNNNVLTDIALSRWDYSTGANSHWLTVHLKTILLGNEVHFQVESISRIAGNGNSHNAQQSGEVKKSQYFNTDDTKQLLKWSRIRYERKCIMGTQYKVFGKR